MKVNIEDLLRSMNFKKLSNEKKWYKEYIGNTYIYVNVSEKKIDYGEKILCGRKTILNFSKPENFVVLECVDRLLTKGYKARNIILEYDCGDAKDYIDILLKDENGKAFAVIECKTYGLEFNKAENSAKNEGKQIFRYAVQDNDLKYVILYTSTLENNIKYTSKIIDLTKYNYSNRKELFDMWDKTFESKGFFEEDILPYKIEFKGILKKDLKPIGYFDTSVSDKNIYEGTIYHKFSEIIRRHTISDKNNAYNKIFNLFLCKIVDEDNKMDDEEMDFQWKNGETNEDILFRLSDLYKKGIKDYLDITITDYSEKEIEDIIQKNIEPEIKKLFVELRLYKNNEFAFKEVFNKETFEENCEVIKEVVKLLEDKQIKSKGKHQLLGDFFEKLLNLGIKQEEGQFFTPIPITDFIIKSLPIENIIENKLKNREPNFLPYVIDYACGSGHFLTEGIKYIDTILKDINPNNLVYKQKENFDSWKNNYRWASEFIYGIEKDYRLAKTTKIACFLNGDGLGNIICADGLSSFNSNKYRGILKSNSNKKNNSCFDIVIANPPYSVDGFKNAIEDLDKNFTLSRYITNDSKEIECLFIERTNQLLKDNGVASIILPLSTLTNPQSIHSNTRKLILDNFDIISIITLGSEAFMATDMKTIILFLKKKNPKLDNEINFTLSCNLDFQNNKKLERKLLGYEFSKRKGKEGIIIHDGGIFQNYSDANDKETLCWFVKNMFLHPIEITKLFNKTNGKLKDTNNSLYKYIRLNHIDDIVDRNNNYTININQINYDLPNFKVDLIPLSELLREKPCYGKRPKGGVGRIESGILSIGGRQLDNYGEIDLSKPEYITEDFFNKEISKSVIIQNDDILMCKDGARSGKVAFATDIDEVMTTNEHVFILRCNDNILPKYLFYYMYSKQGEQMIEPKKTKGGQGGINGTKLLQLEVPMLDKLEQFEVISLCDDIMKTSKDKDKKSRVSSIISEYTVFDEYLQFSN